MEESTSHNPNKGFEFLTRFLKKKFPYVKDMRVIKVDEYFIQVDIVVEFFEFITFYNIPPKKYYTNYGLKGIQEYYKDFKTSSYVFGMIDLTLDDDELIEQFGNGFNKKMENTLNGVYNSLPEDYVMFKYDWHKPSLKEIKINQYITVVDESKETPALKNMINPEYENARQSLYPNN
jgi:hypothetical protein